MSDQLTQQTAAHRVTLSNGIDLVGWGIRADTVVVQASGLTGPITVAIDGHAIEVTEVIESNSVGGLSLPLTALELPHGSLEMQGETVPPHLAPPEPAPDEPRTMGAQTYFWCLVFPRMRGCR